MHKNRVKWTRFQSIKNKYIRLGFYTYKSSPIDLIFIHRNRVHWTWFLCIKTESSGLVFYRCLIYVFFSATRHSNVSLKKTLLSQNSLIPSHTHSPLKKKTLHRTQKTLSFPHSQSSHTHSPLTQKNSISLSLHSISVSAPVTHSLIWLRRRPSLSLIPSLQLHCRHLLRRRRPSISLRLSLSSGLSLSFPLRPLSLASPSLCCQLLRTYISILLLLWFLSIFPCTFWSIAIHFFLFLLSVGMTGFAHKETVLLWFLSISDQLQFIFSCFYWVGTHTKKSSSKLSVSKLRKRVQRTRFPG